MGGIKLRHKCIAITTALILLLLTGCDSVHRGVSTESEQIPELIEPVASVDMYRPAEVKNLYHSATYIASVVGKDYCHFLKNATPIREICVDIGDYVKEGDILATMDIKDVEMSLEKNIAMLEAEKVRRELISQAGQSEIATLNKDYEIKNKQYEEIKQENCETYGDFAKMPEVQMDSDMTYYMHIGEENAREAVEKAKTCLDVAMENAQYNLLLSDHKIRIYEEEIERLQKDINRANIIATHEGVVTYVKDMSDGNTVAAFENIVIVTDKNEISLEISEKYSGTLWSQMKTQQGEYYIQRGENQYPVILHEYSNAEYIAMESSKSYPNISFELDEAVINEAGIVAGDKLPLMYLWGKALKVLSVGLDSIESDEEGSYVYVKEGSQTVRRNVTCGFTTRNDVEIIDGLSEGELVYCTSKNLPPSKRKVEKVVRGDFAPRKSMAVKPIEEYTRSHSFIQTMEATVKEVSVKNNEEVKKGDLLCTLSLPEGKSALVTKENEIEDAAAGKLAGQFEIRKQLGNLEEELKITEMPDDKELKSLRINELKANLALLEYEYDTREKIAAIELKYSRKESGGDGCRYIYADMDGLVSNIAVTEGKTVSKNNKEAEIMKIRDIGSFKIGALTKEDYLYPGDMVYFINRSNSSDVVCGFVVGNTARNGKVYLSKYEDKVYVTQSYGNSKQEAFIQVDESMKDKYTDYDIYYAANQIKEALMLPKGAVYSEIREGESTTLYYYVWKLINNEPVKTYIETDDSINADMVCIFSGLSEGDEVLAE